MSKTVFNLIKVDSIKKKNGCKSQEEVKFLRIKV